MISAIHSEYYETHPKWLKQFKMNPISILLLLNETHVTEDNISAYIRYMNLYRWKSVAWTMIFHFTYVSIYCSWIEKTSKYKTSNKCDYCSASFSLFCFIEMFSEVFTILFEKNSFANSFSICLIKVVISGEKTQ